MSYGLGVDLGPTFIGAAVSSRGRARIVTISYDDAPAPRIQLPQPDGDLLIRTGTGTNTGTRAASRPGRPSRSNRPSPGPGLAEPVPLVLGGSSNDGRRDVPVLVRALRVVLETVTAVEAEAPDQVVLTCPAVWGPVRRRQFGEVSRQVGLDSVTVVSEPEAATAYFAAAGRLAEGDLVVVYDLGAVTVDMTVVRVTRSGTEILGLPEALGGVGGADFDDVVLAHVDRVLGGALSALDRRDPASAAALEAIRIECARAKETLSAAEAATVEVRLPAGELRVGLTRADFESMIRAGLESTLTGLRRSMVSAGVGAGDLAAVVLVGGSTRIPLVARVLAGCLGRPLLVDEHPRHVVALGAAAIADRARPAGTPTTVPTRRVGAPRPRRSWPGAGLTPDERRRRMIAATAVIVALLGWAGYAVVAPLIQGAGSGAEANLVTGPPLPAAPGPSPSSAKATAGSTVSPTVSPTPKVTRAARSRPAARAVIGTGLLVGPTGRCLDVRDAQTADGTGVQLFTCNESPAQTWTAKAGTVQAFGKCLQSTAEARLVISACNGSAAQQWRVVSGGIRNPASKQCIAVAGTPNDLVPVTATTCRKAPAQTWRLAP